MSKINTVTITLNIYDPTLKELKSGKGDLGVSFSASHQYAWQDTKKNNEWVNHTEWFNLTTFDAKTIEYIRENIQKGADILVSGSQMVKPYQAQDGSTRYDRTIRLTHISFIISRQKNKKANDNTNQTQQDKASVTGTASQDVNGKDDDIPF